MNMFLKRNRNLVIIVLVVGSITSCIALFSGNANCTFPGSFEKAPSWVCGVAYPGLEMQAVGYARSSKAGEAFMRTIAEADARSRLVDKLWDTFKQQGDEAKGGKKSVKEETLLLAKIYQHVRAPDKSLYVLIGLKANALNTIRQNSLRSGN